MSELNRSFTLDYYRNPDAMPDSEEEENNSMEGASSPFDATFESLNSNDEEVTPLPTGITPVQCSTPSPPTPKPSRLDTVNKQFQACFDNIFKCVICLGKLNDPCLCPQCSKMYCRRCILEWLSLSNRSCPNCKFPMTVKGLVKLRWIEEIEKLEQDLRDSYSNMDIPKGYLCDGSYVKVCCKEHHLPLKFFCVECHECICETCVNIAGDGAHGSHTFKAVKVVYVQVLKEIVGELGKVENYREQLEKVSERIDQNISLFDRVLNEKRRELLEIVERVTDNLIQQHSVQVQKLQEEKKKVTEAIVILDLKLESMEHDLEQRTKQQMISLQPSIMQCCNEIVEEPLPDFNCIRLPAQLKINMPATCETGVFVVRNFSALQINKGLFSKDFSDNQGRTWHILAWSMTTTDQFGIYLEMVKGTMCWMEVNFKLLHRDPGKTISKTIRKNFSCIPQDGWGLQNFTTIRTIKEEGYLHDDELDVLYNIRPCAPIPTEADDSFDEINVA
ncbi:E3 ubiquitin-protein ligase TRIM37-like [Anopheles aquasalis]|uniref:E3 ubiquitin-protein ligase TRIM37-like n=1 Tax=Anopheles aquasalis TaxID=42839 RepID=UPI00215A1E46|nr:E3 ubiquitin-protein ligase TRIM37-like [Anopheles aquasalis]